MAFLLWCNSPQTSHHLASFVGALYASPGTGFPPSDALFRDGPDRILRCVCILLHLCVPVPHRVPSPSHLCRPRSSARMISMFDHSLILSSRSDSSHISRSGGSGGLPSVQGRRCRMRLIGCPVRGRASRCAVSPLPIGTPYDAGSRGAYFGTMCIGGFIADPNFGRREITGTRMWLGNGPPAGGGAILIATGTRLSPSPRS